MREISAELDPHHPHMETGGGVETLGSTGQFSGQLRVDASNLTMTFAMLILCASAAMPPQNALSIEETRPCKSHHGAAAT